MSDPCFNKLVIAGERVGEVWEKIKEMENKDEGMFSTFVPVPKQFDEWEFDEWSQQVWYSKTFDEGLGTELVVDKIPVPADELKAFIDDCPTRMIYRQGGYSSRDYIPSKFWRMRWKQECWGDSRSNPSHSSEEFDGKTITLSLTTRYSPPREFLKRFSKMYGLTIQNTHNGSCSFGSETYKNGEYEQHKYWNTDVPVEDDDGTIYNKAYRALSEEERAKLREDVYTNAGPQQLDELQLNPEIIQFKKDHSIGCWGEYGNYW